MKNKQQIVNRTNNNVKSRKKSNHQSSTNLALDKRKQLYLSQISTHFQSVQDQYLLQCQEKANHKREKSKSRQRLKSCKKTDRKSKQKNSKSSHKKETSKDCKRQKIAKPQKILLMHAKQNEQEYKFNQCQQVKKSHESKKTVKMQRNRVSNLFINCNSFQIDQRVLQESNVRFNFKIKIQAAIKIQKNFRGYIARRNYRQYRFKKAHKDKSIDYDSSSKCKQEFQKKHPYQVNHTAPKRFNFESLYNQEKNQERAKSPGSSSNSSQIVITKRKNFNSNQQVFKNQNKQIEAEIQKFRDFPELNVYQDVEPNQIEKNQQSIQQSAPIVPPIFQYSSKTNYFPPLPNRKKFRANESKQSILSKSPSNNQLKRWKQMIDVIERQIEQNKSKDKLLKATLGQVLQAVKKNYEQVYLQYRNSMERHKTAIRQDQQRQEIEDQEDPSTFKKKKLTIMVKQQNQYSSQPIKPLQFKQKVTQFENSSQLNNQPNIYQLKPIQAESDQKMNKLPYIFMSQIQDYEKQFQQDKQESLQEFNEEIEQVDQSEHSEQHTQYLKKQIRQNLNMNQISMVSFSQIAENIHLSQTIQRLFQTSDLIYQEKQKSQARRVFQKMKRKQTSILSQQQFNRHCCDTMIFFSQKMIKEKQQVNRMKEDIKRGLSAQHNLELQIRKQARNLGFNLFASKSCRASDKRDILYFSSILVDQIQVQNLKQMRQLQKMQNYSLLSMQNQFIYDEQKKVVPKLEIPHLKINGIVQHRNEQLLKKRFYNQQIDQVSSPENLLESPLSQQIEKRFSKKKKIGLLPIKIQSFQVPFQRLQRQLQIEPYICQKLNFDDQFTCKGAIDQRQNPKTMWIQERVVQFLINEVSAQIMLHRYIFQRVFPKRPRISISKIKNEERIVFIGIIQKFLPEKTQLLEKMNQKIIPSPMDLLKCMRVIFDEQSSQSCLQSQYEQVGRFQPILSAQICMKALLQFKSIVAQQQQGSQNSSISIISRLKNQGIDEKYYAAIQSRQEKVNEINENRKKLRGQIINIQMHCVFDAWNEQIFKLRTPSVGFSGIGLNEVTCSLKDNNKKLTKISQVKEILLASKHKVVDIILDDRDIGDKMIQQSYELLCIDSQWISFAEESLSFFVEMVFLVQDQLFQEISLQIKNKFTSQKQ